MAKKLGIIPSSLDKNLPIEIKERLYSLPKAVQKDFINTFKNLNLL